MSRDAIMLLSLLLSGCALVQPNSRSATLILKPQVLAGSHTQTVVTPYDRASIHHLKLEIFPLVEGIPQAKVAGETLINAQLDNPVVFSNLKPNSNYRIQASAYSTADDTQLISDGASSSVDLSVLADDRPTLATFKVTLSDRLFNVIRKVTPSGGGTTVAGNGIATFANGGGTQAGFAEPRMVYVSPDGTLYLTDRYSLRRIQ